jgi:hypothetical protein
VGWSARVGGKRMVDLFFQSRVPFLCLEDGEGCFLRRLWFLTTTLAREVGKLAPRAPTVALLAGPRSSLPRPVASERAWRRRGVWGNFSRRTTKPKRERIRTVAADWKLREQSRGGGGPTCRRLLLFTDASFGSQPSNNAIGGWKQWR